MQDVFLHMLPFALGIAISPVPIITVILMLFTSRPGPNALGFLAGWFLGIIIPLFMMLMLGWMTGEDSGEAASTTGSPKVRIAGGFFLIVLATWNWVQRNKPDDSDHKSWLMQTVDNVNPWKAVLVGFIFAVVSNPKNFALTVAGYMAISGGVLTGPGNVVMPIAFSMIACLGVALPVLLYLTGGSAAREKVERWKQWLVRHKKAVMAILFLVFGVALMLRGILS